MKVILLSPLPPPHGGIATWTKRMLNIKSFKDWEFIHVDTKLIGGREVFNNNNFNFFIEVKRTLNIIMELNRKIKDKEVKIVHTNIPCSTNGMFREIINAFIVKLYKRKFVLHCRCTVPNMVSGYFSKLLFMILIKLSDGVIVLNKKSMDFIGEKYKKKIRIIPNFVDKKMVSNESCHLIREKVEKVIYIGGVIESKGCYEILEVSKRFSNIDFILIGSCSNEVRKKLKGLNIKILGEQPIERIEKELESADIFLFPTFFKGEGFSNALAEAMAKGLPCIASDWAANRDMLEDNGGIIVPIKNSNAIISAILKLTSCKKRKEISKWNINKVKKNYIDKIVIDKYIEFYSELIES